MAVPLPTFGAKPEMVVEFVNNGMLGDSKVQRATVAALAVEMYKAKAVRTNRIAFMIFG
jgi:hypothetical protein